MNDIIKKQRLEVPYNIPMCCGPAYKVIYEIGLSVILVRVKLTPVTLHSIKVKLYPYNN